MVWFLSKYVCMYQLWEHVIGILFFRMLWGIGMHFTHFL